MDRLKLAICPGPGPGPPRGPAFRSEEGGERARSEGLSLHTLQQETKSSKFKTGQPC